MRVAFMHLPKTGGTSIHSMLTSVFEKDQVCPERFNGFNAYTVDELAQYELFSAHMDFYSLTRIAQPAFTITLLREPKQRILSLYYFWKSQKHEHIERHNLAGPRFAKSHSLVEFLRDLPDKLAKDIDNTYVRNFLGRLVESPVGVFPIEDNDAVRVAMRNLMRIDTVSFLDDIETTTHEIFARLALPAPELLPKMRARENFGIDDPNTEMVEDEELTDEIDALLNEYTRLDRRIYESARALFR